MNYADEQAAKRRAQGLCDYCPFGWDDWCQLPLGHAGDHADHQDIEERQQRLAVDLVHATVRFEAAATERARIVTNMRARADRWRESDDVNLRDDARAHFAEADRIEREARPCAT